MWARAAAAVLIGALALGCSRGDAPREERRGADGAPLILAALRVPHLDAPLALDGELTEPAWRDAARTGPFVDAAGAAAIPYSEARVLWDQTNLYLGLYAADEDIEAHVSAHDGPVWTDDAFLVRVAPEADAARPFAIDIGPTGVVADAKTNGTGALDPSWESGVRLAVDRDGTVNDPHDDDEEWVVEAVVPFAALGVVPVKGTRLALQIARCDTPKAKKRRCGSFGHDAVKDRIRGRIELE